MMKKVFYLAAALLLALTGCKKEDTPQQSNVLDIAGVWELSSVTTKVNVAGVEVSVYLDFAAGGSFTLYQQIGEGRYTKFTGSYTCTETSVSGSYSSGKPWGPYTATVDASQLVLTSASGKETDTYKKVGSVPASVTGNLY